MAKRYKQVHRKEIRFEIKNRMPLNTELKRFTQ